ncbi:MAG: Crp/Fnr family transcriptional regulator [Pseudomonadota bacterium]
MSARARLEGNPWLSQFEAGDRARIVDEAIVKSFPPGAYIHRKGDEPDGYHCVLGGHVDIGSTAMSGAEIRLVRIGPNDWFGEISVLDGLPRTSDAIAVSSVETARIPMGAVRRLSEAAPAFREALVLNLCRRFRQAFSGIDDLYQLSPKQRLAKWLVDQSARDGAGARVGASQDVLSAMIGVSRQSISGYLGDWAAQGLVEVGYGHVAIPDLRAFTRAAGLEEV